MKKRIGILSVIIMLVPLLASCGALIMAVFAGWLSDDCNPQGVLFSETALQGTYQGTVDGYPSTDEQTLLTLVIRPSYVDESEYVLAGTFGLDSEEPLALEGRVTGGCQYQYRPSSVSGDGFEVQNSPPPPQGLQAEVFHEGSVQWSMRTLDRSSWVGPDSFKGQLTHDLTGKTYFFTVSR